MATDGSNNSLYFIVGGLVVVALVFGFIVWGPSRDTGTSPAAIEPAAGTTTQTDESRVDFNFDDDVKSVTKTTTKKTQSDDE